MIGSPFARSGLSELATPQQPLQQRSPPRASPALPAPKFMLEQLVSVVPRTWPGMNKPGGVAKITKYHPETRSYDVAYVLGGSERNVDEKYVTEKPLEITHRTPKPRDLFVNYVQPKRPQSGSKRSSSRKSTSSRYEGDDNRDDSSNSSQSEEGESEESIEETEIGELVASRTSQRATSGSSRRASTARSEGEGRESRSRSVFKHRISSLARSSSREPISKTSLAKKVRNRVNSAPVETSGQLSSESSSSAESPKSQRSRSLTPVRRSSRSVSSPSYKSLHLGGVRQTPSPRRNITGDLSNTSSPDEPLAAIQEAAKRKREAELAINVAVAQTSLENRADSNNINAEETRSVKRIHAEVEDTEEVVKVMPNLGVASREDLKENINRPLSPKRRKGKGKRKGNLRRIISLATTSTMEDADVKHLENLQNSNMELPSVACRNAQPEPESFPIDLVDPFALLNRSESWRPFAGLSWSSSLTQVSGPERTVHPIVDTQAEERRRLEMSFRIEHDRLYAAFLSELKAAIRPENISLIPPRFHHQPCIMAASVHLAVARKFESLRDVLLQRQTLHASSLWSSQVTHWAGTFSILPTPGQVPRVETTFLYDFKG